MEHPSRGEGVNALVRRNPHDRSVTVTGNVTAIGPVPQVLVWRAAAPVTRGISFAGSGQPYPNKDIAYEGTPHQGRVESRDGSFTLKLNDIPAGYYTGLGSIYVPPCVEIDVFPVENPDHVVHCVLWINDTAVPYRWLNGGPATLRPQANTEDSTGRAMYYAGAQDIPIPDSQEALLRAKAYPSDMAARGFPDAEDARPWFHVAAPA